jgi:hypothetical protein
LSKAKALGRVVSALVVVGASCTGTEVGNPVAEPVSVSLTARSSQGNVALVNGGDEDAGGSTIIVEQIWVSLGDARFVIDEDCSNRRAADRVVVDGPLVADLATGPTTLAERLPQGEYCSVRVSLERAPATDAGAPDALAGHSVLLRGHRADGTPVVIRSRDKPDFVLRGRAETFRIEEAHHALFLAFDAAAWLEGVGVETATPNAQGQIVIEPGTEDARLRRFETNLRRSLSLFKDGNADGTLAPSEATDAIASPTP